MHKAIIRACGGFSTTVAVVLALLLAPAAFAQLPDDSGVGSYTENVPAAGGDEASGTVGPGKPAANAGGGGQSSGGVGEGSSDNSGGGAPSTTEDPVQPAVVDDGAAVVESSGPAESTAPGNSSGTNENAGGSTGNGRKSGAGDHGQAANKPAYSTANSPADSALSATSVTASPSAAADSGGVGAGLPIVLGLLLAGAVGFVLYRRRQGAGKGPTEVRKPRPSQG